MFTKSGKWDLKFVDILWKQSYQHNRSETEEKKLWLFTETEIVIVIIVVTNCNCIWNCSCLSLTDVSTWKEKSSQTRSPYVKTKKKDSRFIYSRHWYSPMISCKIGEKAGHLTPGPHVSGYFCIRNFFFPDSRPQVIRSQIEYARPHLSDTWPDSL